MQIVVVSHNFPGRGGGKMHKMSWCQDSVSEPAGGAYDAPQSPWLVLWGLGTFRRRERGKKWEEEGKDSTRSLETNGHM